MDRGPGEGARARDGLKALRAAAGRPIYIDIDDAMLLDAHTAIEVTLSDATLALNMQHYVRDGKGRGGERRGGRGHGPHHIRKARREDFEGVFKPVPEPREHLENRNPADRRGPPAIHERFLEPDDHYPQVDQSGAGAIGLANPTTGLSPLRPPVLCRRRRTRRKRGP